MFQIKKKNEQDLFEEKERIHVVLSSINDIVISTDVNGIVEYATTITKDYFNMTPEEIRGRRLMDVIRIVDGCTRCTYPGSG